MSGHGFVAAGCGFARFRLYESTFQTEYTEMSSAIENPDAMERRRALRERILAQIEEEKQLAWKDELERDAKLKNKRLDHSRTEPEPFATWENVAPEKPKEPYGASDILSFCYRNELGDAELFQDILKGEYVFDHLSGKWMQYNGVIWQPDPVANTKRLAMTILPDTYERGAFLLRQQLEDEQVKAEKKLDQLKQQLDEASPGDEGIVSALEDKVEDAEKRLGELSGKIGKKQKTLNERARQLRGNNRAVSVLKVAASGTDSLGVSGEEWERHPNLFAVANGVVDLETGKLIRSSPDLYLQKGSPYPYTGLCSCSDWWDEHLWKVFCGDARLIDYFEWAVGYSVTGFRYNKDIWVAYGPQADNGKSATFNTIKAVVGGYATTIKVDLLLDDGNSNKGPDPDLMVIDGLRMGIASEAGEKAKFSIDRIKAITGGDDVRARGLFADSKIIESMVKLWLHTNSIPKLSGYDPGFKLRLKVVPFLARFTPRPEELDPHKHVYQAMDQHSFKLMQEREAPAILSWVLRCARKFFLSPRYDPPDVVLRYTTEYFEDQDTVGQFLSACCIMNDDAKTQAKDLYSAFCRYSKDELGIGEKYVLSLRVFGSELGKRYEKHSSNKVFYKGLELRQEWREQEKLPATE